MHIHHKEADDLQKLLISGGGINIPSNATAAILIFLGITNKLLCYWLKHPSEFLDLMQRSLSVADN